MANLLGKKTSVLPPPRSYFESAWGSSDSTVKQARFTRVAPSLDGTVRLRRPPRPRTPGRSKRSCRSQEGGRRQIEAINRTYSSSFSLSSPPPPLVPVKPRSLVCNLRPPSAGGRPQSVGSGGIPVCSLPPGIPREEQMAETHWRVGPPILLRRHQALGNRASTTVHARGNTDGMIGMAFGLRG